MNKYLFAFRSLLLLTFFIGAPSYASDDKINVAIVLDSKSVWSDMVTLELAKELKALGGSEFDFRIDKRFQLNGEGDYKKTKASLQNTYHNNEVDVVIALGVLSSALLLDIDIEKPTIASVVIDRKLQNFPISKSGTSGQKNFHYLASNIDVLSELKFFQDSVKAQHVGLMVDGTNMEALPILKEKLQSFTNQSSFKVTPIINNNNDVAALVSQLPKDMKAVFILPQMRLTEQQHADLIKALIKNKITSFTTMGQEHVENGILMGKSLMPTPQQLARRLAVDIRDIAVGRAASDLSISMKTNNALVLNSNTAHQIGFDIPFTLLRKVKLLNEFVETGRALSLDGVVAESLKRNLNYAIAQEDRRSAVQDTRIARSSLLPQLSGSLDFDVLDRDLVGTGATKKSTAGLSLSQSIYSESNISNYTSTKHFETAQEAFLQQTRLDVIRQTAEAYLNVLIAMTEREIQRDNLELTQANLERAQFRYDVGAVNRSEVYRFETELGTAQQAVAQANSAHDQVKYALNQILHRPIEDPFTVSEIGLEDPRIFGDKRLKQILTSPKQVEIFRYFLAAQSLRNSPEIHALQSQILAQKRSLTAAERKRFIPDVDLVGSVDRVLADSGEQIEVDEDEDWRIGVQFSLPFYQGSRISSEKKQAAIQLRRLELSLKQTQDNIETISRNSVAQAGASRVNINYAKKSADAAAKTLELVTDSYERGTASYIDLIDAQNALLVARLSSANAVYNHLLDLITLQRSIGFFDFYVEDVQKDQWFKDFNEYALSYRDNENEK